MADFGRKIWSASDYFVLLHCQRKGKACRRARQANTDLRQANTETRQANTETRQANTETRQANTEMGQTNTETEPANILIILNIGQFSFVVHSFFCNFASKTI